MSCKESIRREIEYQLSGLMPEIKQYENGGYLSVEYITEKCNKIIYGCIELAKLEGYIKK